MDKWFLILVLVGLVLMGMGDVSAYYSHGYDYGDRYRDYGHRYDGVRHNWDRLNYDSSLRTAHNEMYDYWKYGSYWQHRGYGPIYRNDIDIHYHVPERPYGRHTYVLNCGYEDGFYRDCY
tara:strand:+ start:503 stop:862 length:360 start_codon:yes stop_codon:yes gene_type:complete